MQEIVIEKNPQTNLNAGIVQSDRKHDKTLLELPKEKCSMNIWRSQELT